MDAAVVRAYLDGLPDVPPDERSIERVRTCLASVLDPDVRYLVATVVGPAAAGVARVAAAVLRSAGAPTSTLGPTLEQTRVDRDPLDDALLAKAGTMAAASAYQLAATAPELGELTRREATVILGLTAFAEASQRVALLLDPASDRLDPVHAPRPDLVVITSAKWAEAERALDLVDGRPLVVARPEEASRERAISCVTELGVPALVGGRDYAIRREGGEVELLVREEPYVRFGPPALADHDELATGIATALALGALGIRMREEWILTAMDELRGDPVRS